MATTLQDFKYLKYFKQYKVMRKISKKKLNAFIILIIMFGTVFAFGVGGALLSRNPSSKPLELPQEHILKEPLSEELESFLFSRGYIIVKVNCDNCAIDLLSVESLVRKYDPYVYLIEGTSSNTTVELLGYREIDIIYSINTTQIEDFICDNTAVKFNSCVLRSIQQFNETIPI